MRAGLTLALTNVVDLDHLPSRPMPVAHVENGASYVIPAQGFKTAKRTTTKAGDLTTLTRVITENVLETISAALSDTFGYHHFIDKSPKSTGRRPARNGIAELMWMPLVEDGYDCQVSAGDEVMIFVVSPIAVTRRAFSMLCFSNQVHFVSPIVYSVYSLTNFCT